MGFASAVQFMRKSFYLTPITLLLPFIVLFWSTEVVAFIIIYPFLQHALSVGPVSLVCNSWQKLKTRSYKKTPHNCTLWLWVVTMLCLLLWLCCSLQLSKSVQEAVFHQRRNLAWKYFFLQSPLVYDWASVPLFPSFLDPEEKKPWSILWQNCSPCVFL